MTRPSAITVLRDLLLTSDIWSAETTFKRYEHIKLPHSCDTSVYYVKQGCIKAYIVGDQGEEQVIRFGYSGELVVSLEDFITGKASDLGLQCLRKTDLLVAQRSRYLDFVHHHAQAHQAWQDVKDSIVLQHMERERDLLTASPQERYRRVLARSPRLFQEVPNKYIANYLRMTPETLSRVMNS